MEELRNLLGFVRVVHAGGFSAAAAELGLSAAALSKNRPWAWFSAVMPMRAGMTRTVRFSI